MILPAANHGTVEMKLVVTQGWGQIRDKVVIETMVYSNSACHK